MKVLLVGGGSGGHITPLLAVANKLRTRHPDCVIYYALEKGSRFDELPRASKDIDQVHTVRTGKFRRYHGDSALKRVLDIPTNLKNVRDAVYVVTGYAQSRRLLKRLRPDVIFIKGSSVGVPIGKAAKALGIPYFTHDSDSVASLTNRLLSKHAVLHAVGMPPSSYEPSDKKLRYTGIPLDPEYVPVDAKSQKAYRRQLKLPEDGLILTVTGGSLGAQRLNKSFLAVAEGLLEAFPKLHILHQTGSPEFLYGDLSEQYRQRVMEVKYTDVLAAFTGAADLVVSRAGATTISSLAVQGKACVLIPNPQLTGGHQLHNAGYLADHQAAVIVSEDQAADPAAFQAILSRLLKSSKERQQLAAHIRKLAKPEAADELAVIIESIATQSK